MQLISLLPAALAWAATTSAMLLPPDTSSSAMDAFNIGHDTKDAISVRVPCQRCPVATEMNGIRVWDVTGDKNTDILLEFSEKNNEIYLGETRIYPMNQVPSLMGKQVKAEDSDEFETLNTNLHLSTRMELVNTVALTKDGLTVSEFRMEILGIEDKVVHVGTVSFGVFHHHAKGTVTMSKPRIVTTVTTLADAQCSTILCRIRAQMIAKMTALKAAAGKVKAGCMRMMGMHPRPHHEHQHGPHGHHPGMGMEKEQEADRISVIDNLKGGPNKVKGTLGKKPCPGRKGGMFHGHHHHGIIGKLVHGGAMFARHILMPVIVGVAAGMAVSAFGMVIGQLIFMITMRLRARRNGGYIAVYQVVDEHDVEGGNEKFEEDEIDPLPRYEAGEHVLPPAYDEKIEKN